MGVGVAWGETGRRQAWPAIAGEVPLRRDTHVEGWLMSWCGIPLSCRSERFTLLGRTCGSGVGFFETQQAVSDRDDVASKDLNRPFQSLTIDCDTIAALQVGDEVASGLSRDLRMDA